MARKVINKGARTKPSKGWKPTSSPVKRRTLARKYGSSCFLKVTKTKTGLKDYGYPVCSARGSTDCRGVLAAYRRAKQTGDTKVAAKAKRLGKRSGCAWARND